MMEAGILAVALAVVAAAIVVVDAMNAAEKLLTDLHHGQPVDERQLRCRSTRVGFWLASWWLVRRGDLTRTVSRLGCIQYQRTRNDRPSPAKPTDADGILNELRK